jgi:hypothetical protein
VIFKYGDYEHAANEVTVAGTSKEIIYSDEGWVEKVVRRMTISGVIKGSSQADLTTKLDNLELAYIDGKSAQLYHDDGSTPASSMHGLTSGGTNTTDVRVKNFSYGPATGAEYATGRSFSITLENEEWINGVIGGAAANIVRYNEDFTFEGGGPRVLPVNLAFETPIIQIISQYTATIITQRGEAIGRLSYPPVAPYIAHAGAVQDESRRVISKSAPRNNAGVQTDFPVRWLYVSMSPAQIDIPEVPSWAYA